MIITPVCLVAVSDADCALERLNLKVLMKRAVRIEERMIKGVNLTDEQRRYHILSDRIEYYGHILADETKIKTCELSSEYLELLAAANQINPDVVSVGRLITSFCPSELVVSHLTALLSVQTLPGFAQNTDLQMAVEFYHYAKDHNLNVIELQEFDVEGVDDIELGDEEVENKFLSLRVRDDIVAQDEKNAFIALQNQIKLVVQTVRSGASAAVNFSDLRHDVIAEILHETVYGKGSRLAVPVMYADGSVANHFPLYCLKMRGKDGDYLLREAPVLNVGMMSERHPELDPKVKVYWFRNQEISTGKTAAEIDDVAYGKSKELLAKMRDEGIYKIAFYQTGFQPAVVGFYRALTEELIFRSTAMAKLSVTPYYFLNGEYRVGKTWI